MKNLKKLLSVLLVFVIMLSSVAFAADEAGINIYVSISGNDLTADGTNENPFATLSGAKNYVATLNKSEAINVIFKEGKYFFDKEVVFNASDSGTENAPITYKADDGADVVFTGAANLNKELFTKIEDTEILRRLPKSSRSKVLMLELKKQGITPSEEVPVLYVNDNQQTIARYPNEGYTVANNANGTTSFDMGYENAKNWTFEDAVFVGSMEDGYLWSQTSITAISDTTVYLDSPVRENTYFFVRNLLEELDAPGEYVIKDNILYYYPVDENIQKLDMEIVVLNDKAMIKNDGASYIGFDGITFEKSNSSAINGGNKWVNGICVTNCNFRYINGDVLDIRGYNHTISDNYAYGCGSRFINFEGGEKEGLVPGNIIVRKNRIVGCGNLSPAVRGMIKGGEDTYEDGWVCIGNKVTNNIIQDCYSSTAINVTGNDNIVMYNEVINMGRIIEDGGAIYSGKSVTKYGSEIAYNYIHDFDISSSKNYAALYSDDGMSGLSIHHNVIKDVSKAMISGLGMDNDFSNNLMINVKSGIELGTRMVWSDMAPYEAGGYLYQEASGIINNSELKAVYNEKYDNKIETAVGRTPFFAPWNTVVTGNVSIGNADAIASRPMHAYKTNDTVNVTGEDEVATLEFTSVAKTYVDEIATYGDATANAAGINATALGNPKASDVTFKDEANQNYTITSGPITNSTVHEIDMSEIGILGTSNDKIFAENDTKVNILDVAYDTNKATITWEPVEKASKYDIVITKDGAAYETVTCHNIFHTNKYTFALDGAGTYKVAITARGLSREDMFAITGEKTFTVNATYTDNLANALSILEDIILDAEKGYYTLTNKETLSSGLKANEAVISSPSQNDIDSAEEAVYELIASAEITPLDMEITRFEAVESSNIVEIEAIGLPANSLATVMVTNPDITKADVEADVSLDTLRFLSTVFVDNSGKFEISFDTSKNEVDYTGVYDIYVTNSKGEKLKESYTYGTVELSAVKFENSNGVEIKENELATYAGQEIKLSISVKNRLPRALTPEAYLGIYEGNILKNAFVQNETIIDKNSDGTVKVSVTVPSDYTSKTQFKLFMWDDAKLLRPLTKTEFIFK